MSWWGKIIGGAFGYILAGPLGAALGVAMGHNFDAGLKRSTSGKGYDGFQPGDQERVQTAFFTATFAVMGHIAKADGRVSENEIAMAKTVMQHMQLDTDMRRTAINLFNEGKSADFPLDEVIEQLRYECHRRHNLIRMFVEIQIQAAYADGVMHPKEQQILLHICEGLGISRAEYAQLEAFILAQKRGRGATAASPQTTLQEAYAILGVKQGDDDKSVKRAYRRLMNQHHPDKLVAKGLPEEMMQVAKEKTQKIQAAYEQVKESRGMR